MSQNYISIFELNLTVEVGVWLQGIVDWAFVQVLNAVER